MKKTKKKHYQQKINKDTKEKKLIIMNDWGTKIYVYVCVFSVSLFIELWGISKYTHHLGSLSVTTDIILVVALYVVVDLLARHNFKKANFSSFSVNRYIKILAISCVNVALVALLLLLWSAPIVKATELVDLVSEIFKVFQGPTILIVIILLLITIYKNYLMILDTKKELIDKNR